MSIPLKKAPSFELPDQSGEKKKFSQLAGKKGLVLYAYPKDNTSGCTAEAQEFRDLADEFQALGFHIAGLSKDSVKSHTGFAEKHGLGFPLLSDPDLGLLKELGAYGEKKMYGKVTQGTIRSTYVFDSSGKPIKVYSNVKAKGHAAKVLDDLRKETEKK